MITITSSHGCPLDEPLVLPVPDTAAWREVEALGMDLVLLYHSIQRSPAERIREHASALDLAVTLRTNFQKQNALTGAAA
jgi:hypothetical protein